MRYLLGYEVHKDPESGSKMYAYKGLSGRLAPIGVHLSMLLILAGATAGILAGVNGDIMIPEVSPSSLCTPP